MDDAQLIAMLRNRRDGLALEAARLEIAAGKAREDVHALDVALRVLGYDGDLTVPKRPTNTAGLFAQKELSRLCGAILRDADGSLSTREVARQVIARKGWDGDDARLLTAMTGRVGRVLDRKRAAGSCVSRMEGTMNEWLLSEGHAVPYE